LTNCKPVGQIINLTLLPTDSGQSDNFLSLLLKIFLAMEPKETPWWHNVRKKVQINRKKKKQKGQSSSVLKCTLVKVEIRKILSWMTVSTTWRYSFRLILYRQKC